VLRDLPKVADPNLLVGTETADDAGVYRLTDEIALVQTIDFFPPLVDDPFTFGQIAATNALSDVYAMGGKPLTALNLAGFPDNELPMSLLGDILRGGADKCKEAGCVVVGGHTVRDKEIKFGLSVTGTVHPKLIWINAAAKAGDCLILTKPLGTGFITTANKKRQCPKATLDAAIKSMAMLNKNGAEACHAVGGVHSVTDITGFGLAGHTFEMAQGSNTTIELHLGQLPLFPGVRDLVKKEFTTRASKSNREFVASGTSIDEGVDPVTLEVFFDAQTSGGLLISIEASKAEALQKEALQRGCIVAAKIGRVLARQEKALIVKQ
jgi:selenide,water dikinase